MASGFVVMILFVVIPLALGIILIVKSKPQGLGYPACGRCRYDLSGSVGVASRCPECGAEFIEAGIIPPAGRRNGTMVGVGITLIIIPVTCMGMLAVTATMSYQRASAARQEAVLAQAQATLAQQQARALLSVEINAAKQRAEALAQQSDLLNTPIDESLVARYRASVSGLSEDKAFARLAAVIEQQSDAVTSGTLDEATAMELRAEMQALLELLECSAD